MASFSNGGSAGGGAPGTPGEDGDFIYTAFGTDNAGAGFSLTPSDSLKFRAEIRSPVEIVTPVLADFAGAVWVKYIGDDGTDGADGDFGYAAFASDASGTGFSLTASGSLKFRAEIRSPVEIVTPVLADFAGATWVKYIGDDGTDAVDGDPGADGVDGKKGGYDYKFSTSLVAANPTTGYIRLDTADTAFAVMRINQATVLNVNQDLMMATRAAGDGVTVKSQSPTGTTFLQAVITSKPTDLGSYWTVPVAYVAGAVPTVNDEAIAIEFTTQGQKAGTRYDFDTTTTGTGTAVGTFRLNNANVNACDTLFVNESAFGSVSMVGWLDTIIKNGHIEIKANGNNQNNVVKFKVRDAFSEAGTLRSIPVTYLAGGNFTAGDQCVINYIPSPNVNWDGTHLNDETGAPIDTPLAFDTFADAVTGTALAYVGKTAQCRNPGNNDVSATDRRTVRGRAGLIFSNPDSARWECADGEMLLAREAPAIAPGTTSAKHVIPASTFVGTYTLTGANSNTETKIASAGAHGFTAADVGRTVEILSGANWTLGVVAITAVTTSGGGLDFTVAQAYSGGLGQPSIALVGGMAITSPASTFVSTFTFASANGGAATKITSGGVHGLTAANLGAMVEFTAGTDWDVGLWRILAIDSTLAFTVDHPYSATFGQPTITVVNGTSNQVIFKRIKGPALSVDGGARFAITFDCTGVSTKRPRVLVGIPNAAIADCVDLFNTSDTAANTIGAVGGFDNRGSTNKNIGWHNSASGTGAGTTTGAPAQPDIETTNGFDILITGHVPTAGDMIQLSRYAVWVTI